MRKFAYLLSLIVLCLVGSLPAQVPADSVSFTGVAKESIPAVVSISVKAARPSQRSFFFGPEEDDSLDLFQQFFGRPRMRQRAPQQQEATGQASGFLISKEGLIVTNAHVVKDAREISVILNDGREFVGTVVGEDPSTDVAVVKIEGDNFPYLELGNSDLLDVGQWVMAIGNPLGLQASVSVGVVSAKGRNNLDIVQIEDFIQTDAAINRGNSGGPLMNLKGEVIGMNAAIVTSMGGGGYMGIGFAIPSNMIQNISQELVENGSVTRGFMGVTLQQVDRDLAEALGLPSIEGALVAEVSKDSPADQAGLKQGDVILQYNQSKVQNIAQLRNAVSLMRPGTRVQLTLLRGGKEQTVSLKVGSFPDQQTATAARQSKPLGLEVAKITPEIAENLGYYEGKGVVVTKVAPGSPASWAGFRSGVLILEVNQQPVKTPEEFSRLVKETPADKPVLFLIRSGDAIRYLSLK